MLRINSKLKQRLGPPGVIFLENASKSIQRILPHVTVSSWTEKRSWEEPGAKWASPRRQQMKVTISIGDKTDGASLTAQIKRQHLPTNDEAKVLETREYDLCKKIAVHISQILKNNSLDSSSLSAIYSAFDEYIIAQHIADHNKIDEEVIRALLNQLHTLSEQSYENKSLTFGCVIDANDHSQSSVKFPDDFLKVKKYKAMSDGFHTAYLISRKGAILDFIDLNNDAQHTLSGNHYFPTWAEPIATASQDKKIGLILSRQGDILIFEKGSLRFTYRYGKWQYWNHTHLSDLLKKRARAQHVQPSVLGRVVNPIYRTALDVSFRRSGGLFVILKNRTSLHKIVRNGDAIDDTKRSAQDSIFDKLVKGRNIKSMSRAVIVDIAALDGAVVFDNSGKMLAYGAVLSPKKKGRLRGTEGSRTKAAMGASNYGLAIKVSSDGDITVYHKGKSFIKI